MPYNFQNTFEKPAYTIDSAKTDLNFGNAVKNVKDIYAFKQEKNLNDAWANNYDSANQKLDANGFIAQANKAGIGPSAANAWLANKTAISETTLKTAKNDSALSGMGKDPSIDYNAMGKGYSVEGAGAPVSATTIDADKLPDPNAPGYGASKTQIPAPTVAPSAPSDKTAPANVAVTPNVPKTPAQLMTDRQSATATGNADGSVTGTVNITGVNPEATGGEEAKMVDPGNYIEPDRRDMVDKIRGSNVEPTNANTENPTGLWDAKSEYKNTAKNIKANDAIDFVTSQFATPKVKKDANGKEVATTREERAQFAHDNFIKQAVAGVATTDNDYMPLPPNVVAAKRAEAIQKAEVEWNKKIADAVSSEIAGQGNKRANTQQAQTTSDWQKEQDRIALMKEYPNVKTSADVTAALPVKQANDRLDEQVAHAYDVAKQIREGKLAKDDVPMIVGPLVNGFASLDGATTNEMRSAIEADPIMRRNKSMMQIVHEGKFTSPAAMSEALFNNLLSSNNDEDYAHLLELMATSADKTAKARMDRKVWTEPRKNTPAELHNDRTGSGAEGTKENPIPYTRGMKTIKGKWYNVAGIPTLSTKGSK